MKKLFLVALTCIFAVGLSAQNVKDVWLLLQNKNITGAQKKIEECMAIPTYQNDATAWLYRGNVYIQIYERDKERVKNNPQYVTKFPDALFTAYESFYKALEINPKLVTENGLIDPENGQVSCGSTMFNLGKAAYDKGDYAESKKYFNVAAKALTVRADMKEFVGYSYAFLAEIAKKEKNMDDYKQVLDDALKTNPNISSLYELAYNYYEKQNDTVKCGEILKSAKKNLPKEAKGSIYSLELNYLSSVNDSVQLAKCFKNVMEYTNDTIVMNNCAISLSNAKQYAMAHELLDSALLKHPKCFDIISNIGNTYFQEACDYYTLVTGAMKHTELPMQERIALSNKYKEEQKELMVKAYDWAIKAYPLNPSDVYNNNVLKQTGKQLEKELPDALK